MFFFVFWGLRISGALHLGIFDHLGGNDLLYRQITHLWVEEEFPVGNVTYRRTLGILRKPPTLTHSAALSSALQGGEESVAQG
jgi:hypothetical protein